MANTKLTLVTELQSTLKVDDVNITDAAIKSIQSQLDAIKSLRIKIDSASISDKAIKSIESAIGNINVGSKIGNDIGKSVEKGIEFAGGNAKTAKTSRESIIKERYNVATFGDAEEAKQYFKDILDGENAVIATTERFGSKNNLESFTVNIKRASGEVESLRYHVKEVEDELGNTTRYFGLTGSTLNDSGAIKQIEQTLNAISSYKTKYAQFKSTNASILSGLSNETDNFESVLAGLKSGTSTISDVRVSFDKLNSSASNITKNFTGQLNKIDAAIREISGGEQTIRGLEADFAELSNVPQKTKDNIANLSTALNELSDIEKRDGRNEAWAKKYREWSDSVRSLRNELTALKKEEKANYNTGLVNFEKNNLPQIRTNNAYGNYAAEVDALRSRFERLGLVLPEVDNQLYALSANQQYLDRILQNESVDVETVRKAWVSYQNALKTANKGVTKASGTYMSTKDVATLENQLRTFKANNSAITKESKEALDGLIAKIQGVGNVYRETGEEIRRELNRIEVEERELGNLGDDWITSIKKGMSSFTTWVSATSIVMASISEVKKMVENVKQLDSSLVELRKVSNLTTSELKSLTKKAYDLGDTVAKTGTQVIDAITTFKRAGYDIKESTDFAQIALQMVNVSEGINDAADSAQYLISVMKGYKDDSADFARHILDAVNEVDTLAS